MDKEKVIQERVAELFDQDNNIISEWCEELELEPLEILERYYYSGLRATIKGIAQQEVLSYEDEETDNEETVLN